LSIGQRIKRLRELHGITQKELAKIADVSVQAVSSCENDGSIPRMGPIERMAIYFGLLKSDIIEDNPSDNAVYRAFVNLDPDDQARALDYIRLTRSRATWRTSISLSTWIPGPGRRGRGLRSRRSRSTWLPAASGRYLSRTTSWC
jgi:transcriptional regulator with XRE-family HTH domain